MAHAGGTTTHMCRHALQAAASQVFPSPTGAAVVVRLPYLYDDAVLRADARSVVAHYEALAVVSDVQVRRDVLYSEVQAQSQGCRVHGHAQIPEKLRILSEIHLNAILHGAAQQPPKLEGWYLRKTCTCCGTCISMLFNTESCARGSMLLLQ